MRSASATFSRIEAALVATVLGSPDPEAWDEFRLGLLERVQLGGVRAVVVDLSAVHVMDPEDFEHLRQTMRMAAVLGARAVLSGVSPVIARTMVELGIDVGSISTSATLRDALERAFGTIGVTVTTSPSSR